MPFALFDCHRQVSVSVATAEEVWKQALEAGLIADVPVADEDGGQVLPIGYHVEEVAIETAAVEAQAEGTEDGNRTAPGSGSPVPV